jgi:hypothetical protein
VQQVVAQLPWGYNVRSQNETFSPPLIETSQIGASRHVRPAFEQHSSAREEAL